MFNRFKTCLIFNVSRYYKMDCRFLRFSIDDFSPNEYLISHKIFWPKKKRMFSPH